MVYQQIDMTDIQLELEKIWFNVVIPLKDIYNLVLNCGNDPNCPSNQSNKSTYNMD